MGSLIDIQDLTISFQGESGHVDVLNGASISLDKGESLGIVGESGSGKTVLVRAILGLLEPPWKIHSGKAFFDGVDLLDETEESLREIRGRDIAVTTPEPRKHLNPLMTIGNQIANVIKAHNPMGRKQSLQKALDLLAAVGIPDPSVRLNSYPHELSGGMCQRVIIAMALANSPRVLIADEPTAGLDVTISRQILDLMHDLIRDFDSSLILVTRDLGVVAHYCERVAVMYRGRILEVADVPSFFTNPAHPYSHHLIKASQASRDSALSTELSSPTSKPNPSGCSYFPRCPVSLSTCQLSLPPEENLSKTHIALCFRSQAIASGEILQ